MAKLTGPLLSEQARGSMGPRLTYSERKSGSQVRFQKKQTDVESEDRTRQRTRFWVAVQWWNDLSDDEKAQWVTFGRYI